MPRIDDGHPTTIEFSESPGLMGTILWEKTVTPPGMQGGGGNDTTTMRNNRWRTMAPKKLMTLTEMKLTVAYAPGMYEDMVNMMQVNQLLTIEWPDGEKTQFWGFLDEVQPNEVQEGEQPDADVTIVPTNQDDDGNEVPPASIASS